MSDLEKLVPLLNNMTDQAFTAFVMWWVGEYIITPIMVAGIMALIGYGIGKGLPALFKLLDL